MFIASAYIILKNDYVVNTSSESGRILCDFFQLTTICSQFSRLLTAYLEQNRIGVSLNSMIVAFLRLYVAQGRVTLDLKIDADGCEAPLRRRRELTTS